jgi:uncharacterized iron-regulated protein
VREGGLDALPFELRETLPAIDVEHYPEHRAFIRKSYDDHKEFLKDYGDEDFEHFYLVQCLWEEVMADEIVRWFRTAPDDAQIVVLAGGGHVANRYGIPERVHRRNGKEYKIVLPVAAGEEGVAPGQLAESYADFVWITKRP